MSGSELLDIDTFDVPTLTQHAGGSLLIHQQRQSLQRIERITNEMQSTLNSSMHATINKLSKMNAHDYQEKIKAADIDGKVKGLFVSREARNKAYFYLFLVASVSFGLGFLLG